tara:strand:+ start:396 stop:626 length:231 start_codon:yes stop_codon:yes gene_type:complete
MKFHQFLKHFMDTHRIKKSDLRHTAGFNKNILSWWLSGRNLPNSYSFVLLCTSLHLLTGIERSKILDDFATAILKS